MTAAVSSFSRIYFVVSHSN